MPLANAAAESGSRKGGFPIWLAFVPLPCTPAGEDLIGPRAYRVLFALVSLPLAALALVYFINHRYSGTPLWNVRGEPAVHELVWVLNFISFFFLYPSTFNILEVRRASSPLAAACVIPHYSPLQAGLKVLAA